MTKLKHWAEQRLKGCNNLFKSKPQPVQFEEGEINYIRSVRVPERWGLRQKVEIANVSWLVESTGAVEGRCAPLRGNTARAREILFTSAAGQEIAISLGSPSKGAKKRESLITSKTYSFSGTSLELADDAEWKNHTQRLEFSEAATRTQRDASLASWRSGILYKSDKNGPGLRTPQIGALHAIASHWTVSQKPGIIVMPTGTGKTEVMVATALASQCQTVLVVVPSDALRSQTARKFQTLGVLRSIEVVPDHFQFPVVATLRHVPKKKADLAILECCNVIVATMSALAGASGDILDHLATLCTHLFIDEAHHAPAHTWDDLRQRFEKRPILQFTATPFRRDGKRMEGRILYNYPLVKAQTEGYFRPIRFEEIWEWEQEEADRAIAAAAIARLREDRTAGFNHIIMARTDSIARAEAIFRTFYSAHSDLNPIVIHNHSAGYRKAIADIKALKHQIIVCVDMLGEGFDLPQLKIAALHDAHRSLGVTLQFAGRFTRSSPGIGQATVVANLADRGVSEALEELFSEDADWNRLLPDLSFEAIRPQQALSDFVIGLQSGTPTDETEVFTAATIQPKTSTVVYTADKYRPDAFRSVLPKRAELVAFWKNPAEKVLFFILLRQDEIDWASAKDKAHLIYDLYVVHYDDYRKLLFIHSSVKSTHSQLAKAIGGNVTLIQGENMFRVLGGIERLLFYNAGLLRTSGQAVRFQMYAGLDVAKAIDPVEQQGMTKSNLFGAGFENGQRVTIGCSRKGTIWSLRTSSIPEWRRWCRHVGKKLRDQKIATDDYLAHTLAPAQIISFPNEKPLCVDWPEEIFERGAKGFDFVQIGRRASWLDCSLELSAWSPDNFEIALVFPDAAEAKLRASIDNDSQFKIEELPHAATFVESGELKMSLAEYLQENSPLVRFLDGTELFGNVLIKPRVIETPHLDVDSLIVHAWQGVNITVESKWKNGAQRQNSVQGFVIAHLLSDNDYTIVIDDDDQGEVADVIGIRENGDRVEVHLFHCKFSKGASTGSRVDDLYVVCGQAEKAVNKTVDFSRLADHVIHRENHTRGGRPTRFERGNLKDLYRIQRKSRKIPPEYSMSIVQPGLSKAQLDPEHSAILGAASLFLRQRLGTALKVWCST